jgi:hypothetical protein
MQGNTHFKNKIKTFNAYTLPKVHQLGGIARHTWHIVGKTCHFANHPYLCKGLTVLKIKPSNNS